jgi:hypothetical protein
MPRQHRILTLGRRQAENAGAGFGSKEARQRSDSDSLEALERPAGRVLIGKVKQSSDFEKLRIFIYGGPLCPFDSAALQNSSMHGHADASLEGDQKCRA